MADERTKVTLRRLERGEYEVTNDRGGTIRLSTSSADFRPAELLLAAMAACSAVDVDYMTSRRSEPSTFVVDGLGRKVSDDTGNRFEDLEVVFTLRFPDGEAGDQARARVPAGIAASHDRLCTVSRTISLGTPVTFTQA